MLRREFYLSQLEQLKNEHIIKVLTGIRRCGKSTILEMYKLDLLKQSKNVIFYNFESPQSFQLNDWQNTYSTIASQLRAEQMNYIILDEVQHVTEFEKLVDALFILKNVDLYITGSNAFLLSSQLATLLSGRYIEINVTPFSFAEYYQAANANTNRSQSELLFDYLSETGFPQPLYFQHRSDQLTEKYLTSVFATVVEKDIIQKLRPSSQNNFLNLTRFMFQNIGNPFSTLRISKILTTQSVHIDPKSVEKYLGALQDSFVLYQANRFDIKGNKLLETVEKYYLVDLGLRRIVLGLSPQTDLGHQLENIICFELLRRYGQVWAGKLGANEIDFVIVNDNSEPEYYQVALTALDPATYERELKPFTSIKNNYPKYLITTDYKLPNHNGFIHLNAANWLLSDTHSLR
ncbi:MAG: ATP-binding protein [Bifidobacteriaceae bacterium]|jgi:predicted AAA+ superfamily ATPase|nr:ATP-binding protein [Bifidobacteriaceae bacterium]